MADSSPITFMPCEVIEYILKYEDIEFRDVLNFSLTCKHFRKIVQDGNNIWRRKFFQRWPSLREPYEEYERRSGCVPNWLLELTRNVRAKKKLISEISKMCTKFRGRSELSYGELKYLDHLFCPEEGAHEMAYKFLTNQLIDIVTNEEPMTKMTLKYYSMKVLRYMTQRRVTDEWKTFVSLPAEKQIMERGAVILAQWSQPKKVIEYRSISVQFDALVYEVKELLRAKHPRHPIFFVPDKWLEVWKENIIEDNQWDNCQTRVILDAICEVMFSRYCFHGNQDLHYVKNSSFINCVLEHKRGTAVALAVVFEAVARRLGVKCEPINFPTHFLLRWRERYDIPDSADAVYYYIDVYNGGRFVTKENCPRIGRTGRRCPIEKFNVQSAATAAEVVQRLACSYEVAARQHLRLTARHIRLRSALELRHLIEPRETNVTLHLCRYYMVHNIDVVDLLEDLNNMQSDLDVTSKGPVNHMLQMLQAYQSEERVDDHSHVKMRNDEVKFAVGVIVVHKESTCLCVIVGWDYEYDAYARWQDEPEVGRLEYGGDQPFYKVLFGDGSALYIAQERLALPKTTWLPTPLSHPELGRYFDEFNGMHYVANEMTASAYPEDAEACGILLAPVKIVRGFP